MRYENQLANQTTGKGARQWLVNASSPALLLSLSHSHGGGAARAQAFDGAWNVTVYTTNGHCGVTTWQIGITGGYVYASSGTVLGGYPAGLAGIVTPSGQLRVNGVAGPRSARVRGRLFTYQGSGTWAGVGPSGTCSGVWSAARYY